MAEAVCLPDNKRIQVAAGETVLEAAIREGIPHAHACGGRAKCSTCRIWVVEGLEHCEPRTEAERALVEPLGFGPEMRLACQVKTRGDIVYRRLVLDAADLELTSQLGGVRPGSCGESRRIVVMFCDIRDFTGFSEPLSPYDVMFVLNRFFYQMGEVIDRNGGHIDKFIGDEIMALYGINDTPDAPLRAVKSALEMLEVNAKMKPYMKAMYGREFEIGIGLHYGETVIGLVGSASNERLTAIGDTVNLASRIENANKEAGTNLLISEELFREVEPCVEDADFICIRLRGTSERKTLYEVSALSDQGRAKLDDRAAESVATTQRFAGLDWTRLMAEDEIPVGGQIVIERPEFDLLVVRTEDRVYALNNACPHLNLPLKDSELSADDGIVCRWHQSCFDLDTGEIRTWCDGLSEDGTSEGMEELGNISKNRRQLRVFPVRIEDGAIWAALDKR